MQVGSSHNSGMRNSKPSHNGGVRYGLAKAVSGAATWGLRHIAHREGGNMPGKLARYIDPQVIADAAAEKLRFGSIAVVGTNGKTTVTNLVADAVEAAGCSVVCNRSGANLASGIATALLHAKGIYDLGVFESDELWLARSLPQLKSRYVVLLNLFRDQLDRCGEIDRIQDSIVAALASSPETVLVYNADDPLCAMVAERASAVPERAGVPSVAFGVAEDMGLQQNLVSDCTMCQRCSHMLQYEYRQYGQLGEYVCPHCGFIRPELRFAARDVDFGLDNISFDVDYADDRGENGGQDSAGVLDRTNGLGEVGVRADVCADALHRSHVHAALSGSYMVYNLLAVFTAAHLLGCADADIQCAIDAFDPQNGRLQEYAIYGHPVLLNLAKNPTGFNQNLRIITQRLDAERAVYSKADAEDEVSCGAADVGAPAAERASAAEEAPAGPSVVAFFINDKEADGHDISWIWDIDFEELAGRHDLYVLAGGIRKNDLQVRLKYADIASILVENAEDVLRVANSLGPHVPVYIITNYTALAPVHNELGALAMRSDSVQVLPDLEGSGVPVAQAAPRWGMLHSVVPSDTGKAGAAGEAEAGSCMTADPVVADPAKAGAVPADPAKAGAVPADPVVIAHLFPDLLNLYGDGGNVRILQQRLVWRGIPVEVRHVTYGETIDLAQVDLVFMGGGPDGEQSLAAEELHKMRDALAQFVAEGAPVLAICGGYQILGDTWLLGEEEVPGLGIIDAATRRPGTSGDRLIDNIALETGIAAQPVIGYENHASRTYLGAGEQALGKVVSRMGHGNNDDSGADGILHNGVIGTYLHGPLLSKNPDVADWLLARALERHAARTGTSSSQPHTAEAANDGENVSRETSGRENEIPLSSPSQPHTVRPYTAAESVTAGSAAFAAAGLAPLDDTEELAANAFMAAKII